MLIGVLLFFLVIAGVLFLITYSLFHVDLDELKGKGELIQTVVSPNEFYKAELYEINSGGATGGFQDRVSITSLVNNEFQDETIYWNYPSDGDHVIEWDEDHMIIVNGIMIDIQNPKTYFNWKEHSE